MKVKVSRYRYAVLCNNIFKENYVFLILCTNCWWTNSRIMGLMKYSYVLAFFQSWTLRFLKIAYFIPFYFYKKKYISAKVQKIMINMMYFQERQSGLKTTSATSRLFRFQDFKAKNFRKLILYLVLGPIFWDIVNSRLQDFKVLRLRDQKNKVSRLRDQKNNQCHGTGGTG